MGFPVTGQVRHSTDGTLNLLPALLLALQSCFARFLCRFRHLGDPDSLSFAENPGSEVLG